DRCEFRRGGQERRLRQVSTWPRADSPAPAADCPTQPRHVVFLCGPRPGCRAGDDYAPGGRQALHATQVLNEDQYTRATYYGAGTHTLNKRMMGTRYAIAVVRFLVDFLNREDVAQDHAMQDAVGFSQERPGTFEIPKWDQASLKRVQPALLQRGTTSAETRCMFGANEHQVDPIDPPMRTFPGRESAGIVCRDHTGCSRGLTPLAT